jgi:hypothetical protein
VTLDAERWLAADHPHRRPAEIAAASSIRLNLEDDPALVPLETLPGRDHYLFPPGEEPPWRWSIVSRRSGRSFG